MKVPAVDWERFALPAVGMGVLAASTAAIFIRLAEAPALAIAFWRTGIAVLILLPFFLHRVLYLGERLPRGRELWVCLGSGVALGAHFGLWVSSLDYTSVAASAVLVTTQPVFVAVLAFFVLGERTSPVSMLGIVVALVGAGVIASDSSAGESALLGNVLALLGAVAIAVYVLIGRSIRTGGLGILSYVTVVYTAAALSLLPVILWRGIPLFGYSGETWGYLLAIAAGPQILGHTVFNWALGYVEASIVSGAILAEPIGSTVLAWLVLGEAPGLRTLLGAAAVLAGLAVLIRGRRKPRT